MHFDLKPLRSVFLVVLLNFIHMASESQPANCDAIKTGTFYYYPKNSADSYIDVRDADYLHETSLVNGDSAVFEIKWTNSCTYSLSYITGNGKITDETLEFFKKHKLLYQINAITKDYYTFSGYIDKTSGLPIQIDTMWFNLKANAKSNELFQQVKNPSDIKRAHFGDTSKYAIIYVYRPGKLANSLGNYLIYFDDNVMCVAKNNSGYIFKILKEGNFKIESRIYNDKASVDMNIKFGNKYYIKSSIPGGFHGLNNYKLKMELMKPEDGETEFYNVDLQ